MKLKIGGKTTKIKTNESKMRKYMKRELRWKRGSETYTANVSDESLDSVGDELEGETESHEVTELYFAGSQQILL